MVHVLRDIVSFPMDSHNIMPTNLPMFTRLCRHKVSSFIYNYVWGPLEWTVTFITYISEQPYKGTILQRNSGFSLTKDWESQTPKMLCGTLK